MKATTGIALFTIYLTTISPSLGASTESSNAATSWSLTKLKYHMLNPKVARGGETNTLDFVFLPGSGKTTKCGASWPANRDPNKLTARCADSNVRFQVNGKSSSGGTIAIYIGKKVKNVQFVQTSTVNINMSKLKCKNLLGGWTTCEMPGIVTFPPMREIRGNLP